MGAPEEAGKVATSAIDAMKSSPGLLALILLQIATMAMLAWLASANNQHRQAREMIMLDRCLDRDKTV